jgi:hypothetical protein
LPDEDSCVEVKGCERFEAVQLMRGMYGMTWTAKKIERQPVGRRAGVIPRLRV